MVKKAIRPPGRSPRRHALSTESLGRSQHSTSVCTIASKVAGAKGSARALPATAAARAARFSRWPRAAAASSPSTGTSARTAWQPVALARYRPGQPRPAPTSSSRAPGCSASSRPSKRAWARVVYPLAPQSPPMTARSMRRDTSSGAARYCSAKCVTVSRSHLVIGGFLRPRQSVLAEEVEVAEGRWSVAQHDQALGEVPGLWQVRVGHRLFIRRELHDLNVGAGPVPVLSEQAAAGAALPLGLGDPFRHQRLDLAKP